MNVEIPQNAVRTVVHTVSVAGLPRLLEKLYENNNVLMIEHVRTGANFKVTVHFAIMDLALMFAAVSANIQQAVAEANEGVRS